MLFSLPILGLSLVPIGCYTLYLYFDGSIKHTSVLVLHCKEKTWANALKKSSTNRPITNCWAIVNQQCWTHVGLFVCLFVIFCCCCWCFFFVFDFVFVLFLFCFCFVLFLFCCFVVFFCFCFCFCFLFCFCFCFAILSTNLPVCWLKKLCTKFEQKSVSNCVGLPFPNSWWGYLFAHFFFSVQP